MLEAKIICDHCKSPNNVTPHLLNTGSVDIVTLMLDGHQIHICSGCVPALAEFLPGVDRQVLARYVSYDATLPVPRPDDSRVETTKRILPKHQIVVGTAPVHVFGWMTFVASRFVIDSDRPEDWLINDLQVGNRSQFAQSGDVPGDLFAPGNEAATLSFEECPAVLPIRVWATYIGKNPEGAVFKSHFEGKVIGFPPTPKIEGTAAV